MKVPVDAVLDFSTVGTQLFLSKENSCGVYGMRLLCNAAGKRDQQNPNGRGAALWSSLATNVSQPWPRLHGQWPVWKGTTGTAACFASSVMQRPRGQTGAILQRPHPTLRSRASTCSYSVKGGQKPTLLYPAPLSDHHLSRVEGRRLTLSTSRARSSPFPRLRYRLFLRHRPHRQIQTHPAAILAIFPAQRMSDGDSIATKQNPRLHPADRFLGTEANHPPSARPSLPSRADERPSRKPLKVTFEKHLSTSTLL